MLKEISRQAFIWGLALFTMKAFADPSITLSTRSIVDIRDSNYAQQLGVTYNFSDNVYVTGLLNLENDSKYGYSVLGGYQLMNEYFVPYLEVGFSDEPKQSEIAYDVGGYLPINEKLGMSIEFDNFFKQDEAVKFGSSYKLTNKLSIGAWYTVAVNSSCKSIQVGLSYKI